MQGNSQPQSTTTTSVQELSPEQRRLLDIAVPMAENFGNNPPKLFPGTGIAPTDPLLEQARGEALDAGRTIQGLSNNANQTANYMFSGGPSAAPLLSAPLARTAPVVAPGVREAAPISSNADLAASQKFLLSDVMNPASNPALTGAVNAAVRPINEAFSQQIMPKITGGAIVNGALGGSRQGVAQGLASNALMRSIGDTSSTLLNKAYSDSLQAMTAANATGMQRLSAMDTANTARASDFNTATTAQAADQNRTNTERAANVNQTLTQRLGDLNAQETQRSANQSQTILQSLGMAPSLANMSLLAPQVTEAVGQQRQSEAQSRLSEEVQRYMSEQLLPFSVAQDIAGLAFGMPGGSTKSTATGPKPADNTFGQVMGGLGMAAQFLPLLGIT